MHSFTYSDFSYKTSKEDLKKKGVSNVKYCQYCLLFICHLLLIVVIFDTGMFCYCFLALLFSFWSINGLLNF